MRKSGNYRKRPVVFTIPARRIVPSMSSVAPSPLLNYSAVVNEVYELLSWIQHYSYTYAVYSMMAFPFILLGACTQYADSTTAWNVALIPMSPTIAAAFVFLALTAPITVFRLYYRCAYPGLSHA